MNFIALKELYKDKEKYFYFKHTCVYMAKAIFKNYAFLKALSGNDGMTTRQICENVNCSYRDAYRDLRNLEAEGVVSSEIEGRRLMWKLNFEILKLNSHSQIVVSFSLNPEKVAKRWEKGKPLPSTRLDAAQLLYESGFPIRLCIEDFSMNYEKTPLMSFLKLNSGVKLEI